MSQVPCAQTINATATHTQSDKVGRFDGQRFSGCQSCQTSNFLSSNRSTLGVNVLEPARLLKAKQDPSHGLGGRRTRCQVFSTSTSRANQSTGRSYRYIQPDVGWNLWLAFEVIQAQQTRHPPSCSTQHAVLSFS